MKSSVIEIDQLACWSLSAKDGDHASTREEAALCESDLDTLFQGMIHYPSLSFFYLGTCHRNELYFCGVDPYLVLKGWQQVKKNQHFKPKLRRGIEAFTHMVRVASSLESEVLGETQITGQFKDSIIQARKKKHLHPPLSRACDLALNIAKKIRHQTGLGAGTVSVAHVAIDGLFDFFESLEDKRALVVGAGSMAIQCIERLRSHGVKDITWANRTLSRIQNHPLAAFCSDIRDLTDLPSHISQFHISVFATLAPAYLLQLSDIKKAPRTRLNPKVILDLGLPRNVDPNINGHQQFYLRDVDEFSTRAQSQLVHRQKAVSKAEEIILQEISLLPTLWGQWQRPPTIGELFEKNNAACNKYIELIQSRNKKEISNHIRAFSAKLLHRITCEFDGLEGDARQQLMEFLLRSWALSTEVLKDSYGESESEQKHKKDSE